MHNELTGSVSIEVHAPPEAVWDLVADIERMAEWSPETTEAHWIGGATTARPGARFTDTNTRLRSWTTMCTITEADRPRRLAFSLGRGETTWCYDIAPTADGCRVTESFSIVRAPGVIGRWLTKVATGVPWSRRVDDIVAGMVTTLERLKQASDQPLRSHA